MDRKNQRLGAWIFGSLTLIFLMFVYLRGGNTHDPVIRLIASILAGLMGFFLTGSMRLVTEGRFATWGKVTIQAGGGAAFFTLIWLSWPKEPVIPVKVVADEAAAAAVKELLADPKRLEQLAKSAARKGPEGDAAVQELLALKPRLDRAVAQLENQAAKTPLPQDVREQLDFVQKTLSRFRLTLMHRLAIGLRELEMDSTPLDSIVEETGLPAVADLQIRLLLPRAKLKEALPKGFSTWSPALRANWVEEASDFVVLARSLKYSESGPEAILLFEKSRPGGTSVNAVHYDGSIQTYDKTEFRRSVEKQAGTWRESWDRKIVLAEEPAKR